MASSPITPIVSGYDLTTSWTVLYTVPAGASRIGIDAAVFNNYSAGNESFSMRIAQTSSADIFDEIITDEEIRTKGNNLAVASIGQAVRTTGTIQAKASANDAISVNITATIINT